MFLEFYKLREQPFGVTPDPRFLYFGSTHREALASLLYSIESKRGFSALVAEPGMGKTSLLFQMLNSLRNSARTAFLFQTEGDSRELFRSILRDLGVNVANQDPVAMHEALNEALVQEMNAGRQVVVVIDEAQNLDAKVLETVRLLSNFETPTQKMMHIVLAGQPGLASRLSEKGMTQLRQRVSNIIRLEPLRHAETIHYVNHRLQAAGHEGPSLFSPDALEIIARVSQGIPRNINSMCFQALSIGFATQSKRIEAGILREVVSDLDFAPREIDRPSAMEPPDWPPPKVTPPSFPPTSHLAAWDHSGSPAPRPVRGKWALAIATFAIVSISIIAFSDSKLGLTETPPGQASTQVVNAVLSSSSPNADYVLAWPDKLKPPAPPAWAEMPVNFAQTSPSDNQANAAPANVDEPDGPPAKSARPRPSPSENKIPKRATPTRAEKENAYKDIPAVASQSQTSTYGIPTRVQVLRSETLFQFADEIYGQSSWTIIDAICAANVQIHGPFSVLSPGQWIQLPSDLVTVTAKYNTNAAIGRIR